jgi:hypothetical protein
MSTPLRPCHSAHSPQIHFKRTNQQCLQCDQFSTCQQETLRRLNQAKPQAAPTYRGQPVQQPPTQHYTTQQPVYRSNAHHYNLAPESALQFDPLPEEGEHILQRAMWNGISGASAAFLNEASVLFRHVKLGTKKK